MRSWWIRHALFGAALGIALIVGVALGYWLRGDVEAYSVRVVAVEGEALPVPPCGDTWYVMPGDTLWHIAATCYDGHTGQAVHEIRIANPGVDPGRLRFGDVLVLPERGR